MQEQLLTLAQVAEYLSVGKFTIYRLIAAKQIPAFKVGNQWRFKKSLVEKWLKAHSNPQRQKKNSPGRSQPL
jgi:excisionase family DNA binding protein